MGKKPTKAQIRVLHAARDGRLMKFFGMRAWWWQINGSTIPDASPNSCVRAGWIVADPLTSPHNRAQPWALTDSGRSILQDSKEK
jgi:hypothetical protein